MLKESQVEINKAEDAKNIKAILTSNSEKEKQIAFNAIYSKYRDGLETYISIRTNGDFELTQDLVQDTFQKVHANLDKYDEEKGAFSTWLYKMAKNLIIDLFRKQKHEVLSIDMLSKKIVDADNGAEFQIDSKSDTPEDKLNKKDRARILHKAVNSIKSELIREVMKMRFFEELSIAEINERLGNKRNHSTVRVAILKGKKILAKKLKANN